MGLGLVNWSGSLPTLQTDLITPSYDFCQ
ncbi:hypothetical protein LYNGBM3L_25430 [Moorena producens 3L]|uniref:Uncharacterized protein n=1 Tax=Moorena producens 3L TaxID=489825 RepID=F4XNP7_9CYAN|nr:hypothetical protein LYNGBM3L_25430 [Moorena producens 3L]